MNRRPWPPAPTHGRALAVGAMCVYCVALCTVATVAAVDTIGTPFATFSVDALGALSLTSLPEWGATRVRRCAPPDSVAAAAGARCGPDVATPVDFPWRVLAVENAAIDPDRCGWGDWPGDRVLAAVATHASAGRTEVALDLYRSDARVRALAPIRRITSRDVLFLFGTNAVTGVFVLLSAILVLLVAGRRPAANAYAFCMTGVFSWLLSVYDYHFGHRLMPLLPLAMTAVVLSCFWLAYAFPDPPARHAAPVRRVLVAASVVAAAMGAWLLSTLLHRQAPLVEMRALTLAFPAAVAVLALAPLVRLRRSRGRAREEIKSTLLALTIGPVIITVPFAARPDSFSLVVPVLIVVVPAGIGWALVRRNLLASTAFVRRWVLLLALSFVAALSALFASRFALDLLAHTDSRAALAVLLGGVLFVAALVALWAWLDRTLFAASRAFRPSIEQLSDRLALLRDPDSVRAAVAEVVARLSPTLHAAVIDPTDAALPTSTPPDALPRLRAGERVWTTDAPWDRHLLQPMRSLGELRAILKVAPKRDAALFTDEELHFIDTIATLGAVALHHVAVLGEVDELRRMQLEAARDEKRLALGLFGAEMSHEIAMPLNFLRQLLSRSARGIAPDRDDVDVGREEVERLERMLETLRRLKSPPPGRAPVRVLDCVRRALSLVRDTVEARRVRTDVDVPDALVVTADPDTMLQLVTNLLRNGAQAAPPGGRVGVHAREESDGRWSLSIVDDGPGVPDELRDRIFDPFYTTKSDGSGVGLAITRRIVVSHGWSIDLRREGGLTMFVISGLERVTEQRGAAAAPAASARTAR